MDCLTYAGNLESLAEICKLPNYQFAKIDICEKVALQDIFKKFKPDGVIHLAAESHVDRSIDGPVRFINTNVLGTSVLLEVARDYWAGLSANKKDLFKFHHVSTDEVYGSLGVSGKFTEETSYNPSSPYSASKAASDHMVRAWGHTYGLPVVITNCSNNYGPFQFPEKLIPLMILNALNGKALPVYGNGMNIRDWLYVDDHAKALYVVFTMGRVGQTYNVGGNSEKTNIEVVKAICEIVDGLLPSSKNIPHVQLVEYVKDRPGHDFRYAINATKIEKELQWTPSETFETGLRKTVEWYINNSAWVQHVIDGSYRGERLGLQVNQQ